MPAEYAKYGVKRLFIAYNAIWGETGEQRPVQTTKSKRERKRRNSNANANDEIQTRTQTTKYDHK